jgi:hypothetical protein
MTLSLCSFAVLAEEEAPEIEFLEYLGMWEGSDEDWVMFEDISDTDSRNQERSEPLPQGDDSTEKSDER